VYMGRSFDMLMTHFSIWLRGSLGQASRFGHARLAAPVFRDTNVGLRRCGRSLHSSDCWKKLVGVWHC